MTIISHVPCEFPAPNPSKFQPVTATKQCKNFLKLGLVVRITRTPDPSEFHSVTATKQCQIFLKLGFVVRITRTPDPSEFQEY